MKKIFLILIVSVLLSGMFHQPRPIVPATADERRSLKFKFSPASRLQQRSRQSLIHHSPTPATCNSNSLSRIFSYASRYSRSFPAC